MGTYGAGLRRKPWTGEALGRFYDESAPAMQDAIAFVVNAGGSASTTEIGNALGLAKGAAGVAVMFGAAARRSRIRYQRDVPWSAQWHNLAYGSGSETVIKMSPEVVAALSTIIR